MKFKEFWKGRRAAYMGTTVSMTALVLALFYLFNLMILGLADHFSWYFYTGEDYDLTVSDAAAELFADIDTSAGGVEIIFCDTEPNIASHKQLDFVYETAVGLQKKYPDLIELSYVNLWLEPHRVAAFRENENGAENQLTTSSVIVRYGDKFLVNTASAYYVLDNENYVISYCGEEELTANILWVTAEKHPVAYFTANHGEEIPSALYRSLVRAGYKVDRIDLAGAAEVPEDAGLLVISAPLYDFQRAAAGSTYVSELDKLESYLASGGQMLVTLDPHRVEGLPRLASFLEENGIRPENAILSDGSTALPGSGGYSLIATFAENPLAARLAAHAEQDGRRTVLSAALPLAAVATDRADVMPILYSPASSAVSGLDGKAISSGAFPMMLMAERKAGGGRLLVTGSAYLADLTLMNGEGYGNRQLVYALFTELGADRVPLGIETVAVDRSAIEDLTLGEADLYTVISAVLVPAALLVTGLVICRKRKNH